MTQDKADGEALGPADGLAESDAHGECYVNGEGQGDADDNANGRYLTWT